MTLSDTCGGSFQSHVCTDFQRTYFYWAQNKIFLVLKQYNLWGPLSVFYILKNYGIFTQIQQKRPSQTPVVARFRDINAPTTRNMFLMSPIQNLFSNWTINVLGTTPPFLYLKNCGIFTQILQNRQSQTPAVARFRDRYAPTSRKYVSTEPKARYF